MTTYFPFIPSNTVAPSFQPTLDGNVYTCIVVWSLFGQRFNLNCFDSSGNAIFTGIAVVDTVEGISINNITWDAASLTATLTTATPHNYKIGATINLTVEGAIPTGFDGAHLMLSTGPNTLTFPLSIDPGTLTVPGVVSYLINLVGGYFNSTLIFRNGQFEVSP